MKPAEFIAQLATRDVDGLSIRYAEAGNPHGMPILLLSPWPESILAFLPMWDAFAAAGRVVAIDLPSFGLSEGREAVRNVEAMGDFLLKALESFGLTRPHVVAPDVATPAALSASIAAPSAFRSLLLGSGAIDHEDVGGILDELVNAPSLAPYRTMTSGAFVAAAMGTMARYRPPAEVLDDYIASYAGDRLMQSVDYVRDYPRSLPKLRRQLSSLRVPVHIIVGRQDPFVPPSNAELLHSLLPGSRLDILEAGHFVWEDESARYAEIALAFFAATSG